jgi:hypothetical protein
MVSFVLSSPGKKRIESTKILDKLMFFHNGLTFLPRLPARIARRARGI